MLGLEDPLSWVTVSEHNVDEWPNAGLKPLPEPAARLQQAREVNNDFVNYFFKPR